MYRVSVRHNVEAAHRLWSQGPDSGKCYGLHGHSFWLDFAIECGTPDERGMVVEYGELKRALRGYLDSEWDHGVLLHKDDPLAPILSDNGCKVAVFNQDPTVEHIARRAAAEATKLLRIVEGGEFCVVRQVAVQETHVNAATYITHAAEPPLGYRHVMPEGGVE